VQAKFEVKYLDVTWYDQDTVLSIQESFIPLKVEFENELQRFVCNTVIYPKAAGVKHGQLAFRYLGKNSSVPFFEAVDGARIPLKKVTDKESGKEWWIEANFWLASKKFWESKTYRTAGKLVVGLQNQICQINIGSSEFTAPQLGRYLSDFKSDLWELILDESSYVTGKAKETQEGGVSEDSIHIISNVLSHAQKILNNPKSELREIQTLKPRKMVKPVTRTFMELSTKGDNRFLTSRATKPSYNVPENRYLLFALERIFKILKQLVTISKSKANRFEAKVEKLNERYDSFSSEKLIDKDLVRKDLEKIKRSYDLDYLNHSLKQEAQNIVIDELPDVELEKCYLKVCGKTKNGNSHFVGVKAHENDDWVETQHRVQHVFLSFDDERYQELFQKDFEYKIEAKLEHKQGMSSSGVTWHTYNIIKLGRVKIIGGIGLQYRIEKFQLARQQALALLSNGWIKKLSAKELSEQSREKLSVQNQLKLYEEQHKKTKLVYDLLEPKLAKLKAILIGLRQLDVKPSATFPNSMTFVQNPSYQAVHSGYKSLRNLTNLSDEDLLLSLEKIDEIGLINMPILYERWCLLQIIKVLIQNYHYVPIHDWKRKLLKIISTGRHSESIDFANSYVKRNIQLRYEPTLDNGRTPDFVMDVNVEKKNGSKHTKRFVMDAKFYSYDLLQGIGGISSVISTLYNEKNYSEDGKNAVFILHPAKNSISEKVSPQSWGVNSFLGELEMFAWDKPLRKTHYHQYGAICANPVLRLSYLDEFQRLIGMFLQFGVENNQLHGAPEDVEADDVESFNFCVACGSHDLTKVLKSNSNQRSSWYECNDCKHFTTYNHCHRCDTRLIKNGDYWTYHSQMPMEPLNIKCPACESLV
jgi:hypothetical protein